MRKYNRKRIKFTRVIIALLLIIGIIFMLIKIPKIFKPKPKEPEKILMMDIVGKDIDEVNELLKEYGLEINIDYKYDNEIEKNKVMTQSISKDTEINKGDKLDLVVSLGKIDKEKLKNDGINEMGKVPVMMYHGIKNMSNSDTPNIGGNVDVDGYTRTVEAFKNDLEFYYQKGYRMIKLSDYVSGNIATEYGKSPLVLTFDDGNDNNILVKGLDDNGEIIIDENSAVGVLESFKKKYPDYNVTAIFFVTGALFNQPEYNEKIIKWLVDNGYEVGNHTKGHNNLNNTSESETEEVVGYIYKQLNEIIGDKYSKIIALPYGNPLNKSHANYKHIINGTYDGFTYETEAALRVGWEPEVSSYHKEFDRTYIKRCRAYDHNGTEFDIEMVYNMLNTTRYISDGDPKTIVTSSSNGSLIREDTGKEIILYE